MRYKNKALEMQQIQLKTYNATQSSFLESYSDAHWRIHRKRVVTYMRHHLIRMVPQVFMERETYKAVYTSQSI